MRRRATSTLVLPLPQIDPPVLPFNRRAPRLAFSDRAGNSSPTTPPSAHAAAFWAKVSSMCCASGVSGSVARRWSAARMGSTRCMGAASGDTEATASLVADAAVPKKTSREQRSALRPQSAPKVSPPSGKPWKASRAASSQLSA